MIEIAAVQGSTVLKVKGTQIRAGNSTFENFPKRRKGQIIQICLGGNLKIKTILEVNEKFVGLQA